jgi:CDP-diacylglycerol--serine O-phosphatidyltransferase
MGFIVLSTVYSLTQKISFAVAPATLAYTLGLRTPLDTIALLMFASCGLARLARFNATVALIPADVNGKINYFEGLPVPSSLFLTSMMAWCVKSGNFLAGAHGDVLGGRIHLFGDGKVGSLGEVHVASFVFAIWGALMVSKTLRVSCLVTAENNTDMLDPQVLIASQHPTSTVHRDTCLES